jgi:RNA polymerase subunit RPABC4/transcription elongation factor Spt4
MGSIHGTKCKCGKESSVVIGGGMKDFNKDSRFPFYCKDCGLVSVNVQDKNLVCPDCNSTEINEYGIPPISIRNENDKYPAIEWGNFKAYKNGNLCPICKEHAMIFGHPQMMFD